MAQTNAEANFQSSTSECQNCDQSVLVAKAFSNLMRRAWNSVWKKSKQGFASVAAFILPGLPPTCVLAVHTVLVPEDTSAHVTARGF